MQKVSGSVGLLLAAILLSGCVTLSLAAVQCTATDTVALAETKATIDKVPTTLVSCAKAKCCEEISAATAQIKYKATCADTCPTVATGLSGSEYTTGDNKLAAALKDAVVCPSKGDSAAVDVYCPKGQCSYGEWTVGTAKTTYVGCKAECTAKKPAGSTATVSDCTDCFTNSTTKTTCGIVDPTTAAKAGGNSTSSNATTVAPATTTAAKKGAAKLPHAELSILVAAVALHALTNFAGVQF